jgi:hypothetical protein
MHRPSPRTLIAIGACAAAAALPAAAHAGSDPLTGPSDIRSSDLTPNPTAKVAEPSDDVMHKGSWIEWWYLHVMDPHSKRQWIGVITSAPTPAVLGLMQYADGKSAFSTARGIPMPAGGASLSKPAADGRPGVRTDHAKLDYSTARKAYHLIVHRGFKADIWYDGDPLPGATGTIDLENAGEWMGWTNPVATSTVHGWIQPPGGSRIKVDGWRGYHDHNWGHFTMVDSVADGWQWAMAHEPDGGASVLGGLVRRGGEWTGAIVDVRKSGTRVCSSSEMHLSDWTNGFTPLDGLTFSVPRTTQVTCGPDEPYHFSQTYHLTDTPSVDALLVGATVEAPTETVPGSFGMYEHVRTLAGRLDKTGARPKLPPIPGLSKSVKRLLAKVVAR